VTVNVNVITNENIMLNSRRERVVFWRASLQLCCRASDTVGTICRLSV